MRWGWLLIGVLLVAGLAYWLWPHDRKPETPYADALLDALDHGKLEQVRGTFQTAHTGITGYSTAEGSYPVTNQMEEMVRLVCPAYVRSLPVLDPWGRPYLYTSSGSSYELRCAGKDGAPGNGDDVVMQDGAITMPKGFREPGSRL